jgi:pilus assembly protein TadC
VHPAGLVLAAAADLRARAAGELDERVAALGVRLVLPLGLAFLPGFLLTTVVPVILTVAASILPGS